MTPGPDGALTQPGRDAMMPEKMPSNTMTTHRRDSIKKKEEREPGFCYDNPVSNKGKILQEKIWPANAPQPAKLVNTDQPANKDQSAV
ncbi:hypothetical protein ElyMa_003298600 [Elysia marginata]|uniref:Uncharacterized protein n=1 Tax=Elysia marginata TaxID=1093978 RepID=A0AAV4JAW8_9GAST|nr:hypothetical protein ElyMa_003298600 [Elysia marginata]